VHITVAQQQADVPGHRATEAMVVHLLAAARTGLGNPRKLPPLTGVELQMLAGRRVIARQSIYPEETTP
jgi:hypothetical protein